MKLWGRLKQVLKFVLPILVESALEKFRKKNPKHGWLVDAVEGAIAHMDTDELTASAHPHSKVELATQQVVAAFPGTDAELVRQIALLVLKHRQVKHS